MRERQGGKGMKLTKAQQEVIDLMADGWKLHVNTGKGGETWLSKDAQIKPISKTIYGLLWVREYLLYVRSVMEYTLRNPVKILANNRRKE